MSRKPLFQVIREPKFDDNQENVQIINYSHILQIARNHMKVATDGIVNDESPTQIIPDSKIFPESKNFPRFKRFPRFKKP